MLNASSNLVEHRWPWALLALSALCLELVALYFQYIMALDPCVMCVYERVAIAGVLFAGLLVCIKPTLMLLRISGYLLWAGSVLKGLQLAIAHVNIQFPDNPFVVTCGFEAEFPSWFSLDQWLPALFQPTGMCDEIQWQFLGYTMPQWLVVCYSVYGVILLAVLASRLMTCKRP